MIDNDKSIVNLPVHRSVDKRSRGFQNSDLEPVSRPIVFACDEGYAMPLATTLRSIVETNQSGCPIEFHVLSEGFSEETRRRVFDSLPLGSASIRWIPVDLGLFQEFATMNYVSKMTFARFLIPKVFPDTISRILYLDADLLVLDDLTTLWEMDLEGYVVGAVLDALDVILKGSEVSKIEIPRLSEVPRVRNYFNAGVLLIDLDRWRKEQISEKSLKYLAQYPMSPYSDQDALNVACDGLWKQLEPHWNFQDHFKTRISDMSPDMRPGIVHFVTSLKPWKSSSMSLNTSFYDAVRNRTLFSRTSKDKVEDSLQGVWYRLKRALSRYVFFRTIWKAIKC